MAMSNPPGQAGPWSKNPESNVHAWIGYEGKKFPCGGYKKGPVSTYKAGQVIPVRFWNFNIKNYKKFPPSSSTKQSRHGGGSCEFSLSYDGGKSWKVIGQYTKTCPDVNYEWPVQIPKNVPSCLNSDKCLFSFSWTAYAADQFYHHCANVEIHGLKKGGHLPELDMTVVDVKQKHQKMNTHANGDKKKGKSSGPDKSEKKLNTNGYYAYKGGAGKKGKSLGLVR
ncbi:hypothetical protein EDD11_003712 [Mortierella claussenii]|nr:hypothetical protein EDD11_003712 [Mortierella claussenii]